MTIFKMENVPKSEDILINYKVKKLNGCVYICAGLIASKNLKIDESQKKIK